MPPYQDIHISALCEEAAAETFYNDCKASIKSYSTEMIDRRLKGMSFKNNRVIEIDEEKNTIIVGWDETRTLLNGQTNTTQKEILITFFNENDLYKVSSYSVTTQ